MMKRHIVTLSLFGLAMACYAASWTEVASGLALFGVLFELGMWVSLFTGSKQPRSPEAKTSTEGTGSDAHNNT